MTSPNPIRRRRGQRAGGQLLSDLRVEIGHADNKASVLVAALGATAGVLSGLLTGRHWNPTALSSPSTGLWWAGTTALAVAFVSLLLAVVPRSVRSDWAPGQPLTYFGDIQRAAEHGLLADALAAAERDPMAGLVAALAETSRIAARKHLWIRTGLVSFGLGVLLLPSSLLFG